MPRFNSYRELIEALLSRAKVLVDDALSDPQYHQKAERPVLERVVDSIVAKLADEFQTDKRTIEYMLLFESLS